MNKKLLWSGGTLAVLGAAWLIYAICFAGSDLVTLDVRNMEVREVVKKMEHQTRRSISVNKEVEGKITLTVHKVPLEAVLNIIDDQVSSRWSTLYPLYTTGATLDTLKKALRGELEQPVLGWTNLSSRSFRGGFGGGFGGGGGGFGGGGNPIPVVVVVTFCRR